MTDYYTMTITITATTTTMAIATTRTRTTILLRFLRLLQLLWLLWLLWLSLQLWLQLQQDVVWNPAPVLCIAASCGFSELTENWIRSSHGHSTPSLKISCKSVQPFSRNLADKEINKESKKQRNKVNKEIDRKQYPVPRYYQGRGNYNYYYDDYD